jgi:hypothetical protein
MDLTTNLLLVTAILAGAAVLTAGPMVRRYHWRRSLDRLERVAWQNTLRSIRSKEQD